MLGQSLEGKQQRSFQGFFFLERCNLQFSSSFQLVEARFTIIDRLLNMRKLYLFLLLWSMTTPVLATFHFTITDNAKAAYEKVTSLRFDEAQVLINRMKLQEPENLIVYHIENYIDFFTLYIQEDKALFTRLKENKNKRLEQIRKGDPNSPYFLFIQADIRLQWALARLKFDEYLTAFREVSKAFKQLKKNEAAFPDFLPNKKDLGILYAMIGTIPDNYKWGVKLLSGMDGTIDQGRKEIEYVLQAAKSEPFLFEAETIILYAFLLLHLENEDQLAWQTINSNKLQPLTNPLHCFVKANIAMRANKNDDAIHILSNRPKEEAIMDFPYLEFMLGTAKLRRLDKDADVALLNYLGTFNGRNFIKEAYQKLAWHELVHNNPTGYRLYMETCKTKGETITGSDKNAQLEATSGKSPDVNLVKARLLFDGGYYEKAYQVLKDKKAADYPNADLRLEHYYRMGRILHGLKRYDDAIFYYNLTVQLGKNKAFFFACNAALQQGIIYEQRKLLEKSKECYKLCLSMRPKEYKTGLHQSAKAGLARLKKRN